ncbi:MAG TPA: protease modulator HflC [Candidatus Latescibacteria bacterium]|nr:protease modulator HflC [Candidatus Latescibacterota bacterium]
MRGLIWLGIVVLGIVVVLGMVTFTVDQTEQAVVVRMGEPVRVVKEPGLHFKLPFPIETVHTFDRRLLEYDSAPAQIYTKDKKNLIVDNYARWRIVDPLAFLKTVRTEVGAQSRLDDIVYSVLREELGKHTLSEVVAENREPIMKTVTKRCDQESEKLGIKVVDVRIKRADLPRENERYVFDRMRAERSRIAKQYRSEGEEMALKIRAQTDLEKRQILAEAYRKAEEIKGEGDAEASRIYAEAYRKDPEFYAFLRSLRAYDAVLDSTTVLLMPPDSPFFRYLRK